MIPKRTYIYDKILGRMIEKIPPTAEELAQRINIPIIMAEHPFGSEWKR